MFGFLLTERAKMNKYQKLLGLNDNFTLDNLKISYRKQVKLNHPDLFKTEKEKIKANRKMLKLNEAYQVLLEQLQNAEIDSYSDLTGNIEQSNDSCCVDDFQDETVEPLEADRLESLLASKCSYVLSSIIITIVAILVSLS